MMNPVAYVCARISVERMEMGDVDGARVWSWLFTAAKELGL